MGVLRCVDGSVLSVTAVACRDRSGQAYEMTLELTRDSAPFAAVGERCGYRLAQLAEQLRAVRHDPEQAAAWPDPDDRFPGPARLHDYQPGEVEYFTLRSRDRGDPGGTGELRCVLRSSADWIGECQGAKSALGVMGAGGVRGAPGGPSSPAGGPRQRVWPGVRAVLGQHHLPLARPPGGHPAAPAPPAPSARPARPAHLARPDRAARAAVARLAAAHLPGGFAEPGPFRRAAASDGCWRLTRRAVIEAWGTDGIGLRAVLTSAELLAFLDTVLTQPDGSVLAEPAPVGGTTAGRQRGESTSPAWRQRGRMPDGSARSRLPALRAKARGVAGP